MKLKWFSVFLLALICACNDGRKYHDEKKVPVPAVQDDKIAAILMFRENMNAEFSDPERSPLPDRFRKDFKGLDFFPPDTNYVIEAEFIRTPDAVPFLMPTTTDRKSEEVVYAKVRFELHGKTFELEVYQNPELIKDKGYEDYLFLPFTDLTNGKETYGGGRYLDLRIPKGDHITIDFNKAYNPYCVYNKKYSCPLVPKENHLDIAITAGIKDFKK